MTETTEPATKAVLALGLSAAFPGVIDALGPGGYCRDEVLFHVVHAAADTLLLDDYEAREIVSADWPLAYPLDGEQGRLVMSARADDVGGPLAEAEAAPILKLAAEQGDELTLEGPLSLLLGQPRALILPAPTLPGQFASDETHPLSGVPFFSVVDVLSLLDQVAAADPQGTARVLEYLQLCRQQRLVLSWRRTAD